MNLRLPALASVFIAATILSPASLASADHSTSTIALMAIDADPDGNKATSLATIDRCATTKAGDEIVVDLVVDEIPTDRHFASFEIHVGYDPKVLEAVKVDNRQLLAAVGAHTAFEGLTDKLPDSDGDFTVSNLDTASDPVTFANMESGPGVISRITFRAKAAGSTVVIPRFDLGLVYPAVLDERYDEFIPVDAIQGATIVVDGECAADPPLILTPLPIECVITGVAPSRTPIPDECKNLPTAATPTPTPGIEPDTGGGSVPAAAVGGLLALGVIAAGAGGWMLYGRTKAEE